MFRRFIHLLVRSYQYPWVKWFGIPLLLLLFWILGSIFLNPNTAVSVLTYNHSKDEFLDWTAKPIYKHQKRIAEFTAEDNYLGIVAVRFNTYVRINSDSLIFRMREADNTGWFYENTYKVDQFQPNKYFTFGFPIIPNSKGKKYIFELESIKGKSKDAVALSQIEPSFVTKYQYPKSIILGKGLPKFFIKKVITSLTDSEFIQILPLKLFPVIPIYFFPFLFYVVGLFFFESPLTLRYLQFALVIPLIFIIQVFFPNGFKIGQILVFSLWLIPVIRYRFDSSVSFLFSGVFLALAMLLQIIQSESALVAAWWSYMFLLVGTFQAIIALGKPDTALTYDKLLMKSFPFLQPYFRRFPFR